MKKKNQEKFDRALEALDQALLLIKYAQNKGFKYNKSQLNDLNWIINDFHRVIEELETKGRQ
jgi:hypothetical protein